eukprot:scaffold5131_cov68-Phaeocystis_antarctica.AAC.2
MASRAMPAAVRRVATPSRAHSEGAAEPCRTTLPRGQRAQYTSRLGVRWSETKETCQKARRAREACIWVLYGLFPQGLSKVGDLAPDLVVAPVLVHEAALPALPRHHDREAQRPHPQQHHARRLARLVKPEATWRLRLPHEGQVQRRQNPVRVVHRRVVGKEREREHDGGGGRGEEQAVEQRRFRPAALQHRREQ